MWSSTVGLVNGKHRYLTAETFGFKINSNGQVLKKRQQWTIEPFPENMGPDGSISSAASVSSQCQFNNQSQKQQQLTSPSQADSNSDPCILTFSSGAIGTSLTSIKSSSNSGSSANSDQDACLEEHENIAIKSHLNKYLAVDSFGNVTCDSDEKTESARFTITICSMSQARNKDEHIFWAFRNVERGYYLGTTEDGMICCEAKMPKSRAELWHLHLIPARGAYFFTIKSLSRKRFARVVSDDNNVSGASETGRKFELSNQEVLNPTGKPTTGCQIQLDATISWGTETLFQFKYFEGGRYALMTSDCMYLTNEGKCIDLGKGLAEDDSVLPPNECLFTLEYHSGFLAFRDSFSHYLAGSGRSSILRSRSIGVSRDELFLFESAPIQVSLKATFNNRWVSIKQGVDLSANQTETSEKFETFQMTFHKQTQNWSIMTYDCQFWTLSQNTSTISVCKPGDYEGLNRGQFRLIWSDNDATCSLKFVDSNHQERWISARKSGQLFLASATNGGSGGQPVKFIMRFQNRKLLNLRPVEGSGFVGFKTSSTNGTKQLDANKTSPDSISIEYSEPTSSSTSTNNPIFMNVFNKFTNGHQQQCCTPPKVHPEPVDSAHSGAASSVHEQPKINMFNVKLNSTKMGQSVLNRFNGSNGKQEAESVNNIGLNLNNSAKEFDLGVDANNNCHEDTVENLMANGSVESSSTASVAAIIDSFSNAKLSSPVSAATNGSRTESVTASRVHSAISKLNSPFIDRNNSISSKQITNDNASDIASVITSSPSTASSTLSGPSAATIISAHQQQQSQQWAEGEPLTGCGEQLAQFECCYLKVLSNDKYLVVGDSDSSILCDATNKACAQSWILELRSHNSIAIRASDNHAYMQLGTNGTINLVRCEPAEASLWEF